MKTLNQDDLQISPKKVTDLTGGGENNPLDVSDNCPDTYTCQTQCEACFTQDDQCDSQGDKGCDSDGCQETYLETCEESCDCGNTLSQGVQCCVQTLEGKGLCVKPKISVELCMETEGVDCFDTLYCPNTEGCMHPE